MLQKRLDWHVEVFDYRKQADDFYILMNDEKHYVNEPKRSAMTRKWYVSYASKDDIDNSKLEKSL